jgi:hypothetical protein
MKNLFISLLVGFLLVGCASQDPMLVKKDVKNISHFVTFRSDPIGADIIVVDSITGKEVGTFGKTPVRILLLSKVVEVNGRGTVTLTKINPACFAVTYGGKIKDIKISQALQADGAEFQFKFRMQGYFDEIRIERIPFQSGSDTDATINMSLKPMK